MRRRLYFLLPDVESTRRTANDLLLARIDDSHMRFLARRGTDLGELHEASYLEKSDLIHAAGTGFVLGAIGGLLLGVAIVFFPPEGVEPALVALPIAAIVGGVIGAWIASMVGAAVPNSRLARFQREIDSGKVLAIIDVPFVRVDEVRELVLGRHPEATPGGVESRHPAFP